MDAPSHFYTRAQNQIFRRCKSKSQSGVFVGERGDLAGSEAGREAFVRRGGDVKVGGSAADIVDRTDAQAQ